MSDTHYWSNVSGYGNIEINAYSPQGIKVIKSPWNRIPAMKKPYSGPINTDYSWSPSKYAPVSQKKLKMMNKSCNICNNYLNVGPKNC